MELSENHKKEIDEIIRKYSNLSNSEENVMKCFNELRNLEEKYYQKPSQVIIPEGKKIIGYNPENFEPIFGNI